MPIDCPLNIHPITDAAFDSIDRLVMACCYASQNELGRLCDERVYENDVAARLRAEGMKDVHTQVPVTVSHDTFTKTYRLDLVVSQMIYELKTVAAFAPEHDTQAIHYAVLAATDRVKLINFRPARVAGRLRRSPLWKADRTQVAIDRQRWEALSDHCLPLADCMRDLLSDWGAFLEARLYEEALMWFCGHKSPRMDRVPVVRDGIRLGTHPLPRHARDIAFLVTAFTDEAAMHESQLRRLLRHLPLRGVQWFNLQHANLQLITVTPGQIRTQ
jgi:GxxExxY protein